MLSRGAGLGVARRGARALSSYTCVLTEVRKPEGVSLTAEQTIAALAETLAEYKLPAEVVFVDVIPKSASGKILRRMLPK